MVDEYQDSNKLQEEIVFNLRKNNTNLAVVGDDYQSIYGFRGSDVSNIIDFNKKIKDCKEIILSKNYRSTQEILDLANTVMSKHANFGYSKNMTSNNKRGQKPILCRTHNQHVEADYVLKEIKKLHKNGVAYKDIAILERSSYHSFILESKLNAEGIPFEKKGGIKFFDHICIQDILALFRCMVNPTDELAWFRVVQMFYGIGDTYAKKIASLCTLDREFLLNNPYKKRSFYADLVTLHEMIIKMRELEFNEQIDEVIEYYCNAREEYSKKSLEKSNSNNKDSDNEDDEYEENEDIQMSLKNDKAKIASLKDLAMQHKSAIAFLDSLALDDNTDNKEKPADSLTISTIHAAKGLEYKVVFILECSDGQFPNTPSYLRGTEKDNEELRCFYVAITRAIKKLYLMSPVYVFRGSRTYMLEESHYLKGCERFYDLVEVPKEEL